MATTTCTGNVIRMETFENVKVDSEPHRTVTVRLTRCSGCSGTAQVEDWDGLRTMTWFGLELPMEFDDEMAAYWAAAQTAYIRPDRYSDDFADPLDHSYPYTADGEYIEDEDGDQAFAAAMERQAEAGTWFGRDPF